MRILQHENTNNLIFADAVLSYPHVIETVTNTANPKAPFEEYCVDVLIPKGTDMADFDRVVEEAKQKKWKGNTPQFRYDYLKDGDLKVNREGKPYAGYAGNNYVTVRCAENKKPIVVDMAKNELTRPDDIVGGDIGHVFASVFAYSTAGNNGISFSLKTVKLKEKVDNPFGGGISNQAATNAMDAIDGDDYGI